MGTYFQARDGRRLFRMRVPVTLRPQLGMEIVCSTGKLDLQRALPRCKLLGSRLSHLLDQAKAGRIEMKLLHYLVRQTCAEILQADEYFQLSLQGTEPLDWYDQQIRLYQQAIRERSTTLAEPFIRHQRVFKNLGLDINDPKVLPIILDFYMGQIEVLRIQKERAQGNLYNLNSVFSDNHVIPGAGFRAT